MTLERVAAAALITLGLAVVGLVLEAVWLRWRAQLGAGPAVAFRRGGDPRLLPQPQLEYIQPHPRSP